MAGLDQALAGVVTWLGANILIDTVRVAAPGSSEPTVDPTTGQIVYPDGDVIYEGPGAIVPASASMERSAVPEDGQPWAQQTRSSYVLLTPLTAPVPPEYAIASVVAVHDPTRTALIGRTWLCADPGQAGTVEVVRRTALDQNRAPSVGEGP